jgi:hypothetical protein
MVGRVKFQVLGKHGWAPAWVKRELLQRNVDLFKGYGIIVRVAGQPTP